MAVIVVPTTDTIPTVSASDSVHVLSGGQDVIGGTDLSALADITDFVIAPEAARDVGTGGNNLKAKITGKLVHGGPGLLVYDAYQSGAASTCARAKLIPPGSSGRLWGRNGTLTRYEQREGASNFNASTVLVEIWQGGGELVAEFITGTSGIQLAKFTGGVARLRRGLDTNFSGSRMDIEGGAQVFVGITDVTTAIAAAPGTTNVPMGTGSAGSGYIKVGAGGFLEWKGWNIDTLEVVAGGVVDFSKCPFSPTVSTLITDVKSRDASKWQTKVPGQVITYTSKKIYGANDDTLPG